MSLFAISLESINILNILLGTMALGIWVFWCIRNPKSCKFALPPILWLFHVLLFEICVFLNLRNLFHILSNSQLALWGMAVELHALFTLLGVGLILVHGKARITGKYG